MKLTCEVETVYILATTGGGEAKSKRARASLSIGRKKGTGTSTKQEDELYLVVSTVKNVTGMKYKIRDNVIHIFARFVKDGKATLRFKEPAHDLSISKADPLKLKEFLTLLKMSPQEQKDVSVESLLPAKMKDLDKPPTKLVVKSRGEYPINGFPSTLETINAVNIGLNRVDKRIINLQNLYSLDLSDNYIKIIPEEMKTLPLVELKLAGNRITEFPVSLCYGALVDCLKTLDISRNQLTHLPHTFSLLKSIVQLRIDCNELQVLPRTFGKFQNLRFFSASSNKLAVLPHSFSALTLESLDMFGNPFKAAGLVKKCSNLSLPSLVELAGRAVKKYRLTYNPQILPVVLCHYLDSAKKCLCGTACLEAFLHYISSFDLHKVSSTVTAIDQYGSTSVPIELFLCSAKCLKLWKR